MAKHNELGALGEKVAAKFLERKGYFIVDRNYSKKWGEIDIVAEKAGRIYFVEVKSVSRKSYGGKFEQGMANNYRPEDNMHPWKLKRLGRAIQTYLLGKYRKNEPEWQLDLACVFLDVEKRVGKVRYIENIVL
jgi:putative endonuclease